MSENDDKKWSIKDKLEMAEAIFTIVVSIMAIWGTIIAWKNGFWYKLKHTVDYYHEEITQKEKHDKFLIDIKKDLDKDI